MKNKTQTSRLETRRATDARALLAGLLLTVAVGGSIVPPGVAQDLTEPSQVISAYLTSLVNGDTDRLGTLIDGPMKQKNRHLELNPDTYSQFLRDHYADVQTVVESVVPEDSRIRSRVRLEYPTGQSSTIYFILTQVNGQWKITDEIF